MINKNSPNLEETIESVTKLKSYLVDSIATTLFYTPLMALTEYLSGMDPEEIVQTRSYGVISHLIIGRPYGIFREWWINFWNTTSSSSFQQKLLVETSARLIMQTPVYATLLYASGASLGEIALALPSGLAMAIATGRPFGYFLDKWRRYCGIKPSLE